MRHSLPVLLCTKNEDFRALIREMLGKSGFFHVLEAGNGDETKDLLREKGHSALKIVQIDLIDEAVMQDLKKSRHYIILSQADSEDTIIKSAILGVDHFLSFPFSSRILLEKIEKLLQ